MAGQVELATRLRALGRRSSALKPPRTFGLGWLFLGWSVPGRALLKGWLRDGSKRAIGDGETDRELPSRLREAAATARTSWAGVHSWGLDGAQRGCTALGARQYLTPGALFTGTNPPVCYLYRSYWS